eukprot:gnl/Chilomastix_cuspidata/6372.p1 GENE.gnl/Chilomastix_cuspidata/6372~~gnl/Chilomastix_cuspidata/6372.p1  ORF type:complete len:2141 (-),score=147.78 gnl/Chilomastix_cuspidata/6372:1049-6895(-)
MHEILFDWLGTSDTEDMFYSRFAVFCRTVGSVFFFHEVEAMGLPEVLLEQNTATERVPFPLLELFCSRIIRWVVPYLMENAQIPVMLQAITGARDPNLVPISRSNYCVDILAEYERITNAELIETSVSLRLIGEMFISHKAFLSFLISSLRRFLVEMPPGTEWWCGAVDLWMKLTWFFQLQIQKTPQFEISRDISLPIGTDSADAEFATLISPLSPRTIGITPDDHLITGCWNDTRIRIFPSEAASDPQLVLFALFHILGLMFGGCRANMEKCLFQFTQTSSTKRRRVRRGHEDSSLRDSSKRKQNTILSDDEFAKMTLFSEKFHRELCRSLHILDFILRNTALSSELYGAAVTSLLNAVVLSIQPDPAAVCTLAASKNLTKSIYLEPPANELNTETKHVLFRTLLRALARISRFPSTHLSAVRSVTGVAFPKSSKVAITTVSKQDSSVWNAASQVLSERFHEHALISEWSEIMVLLSGGLFSAISSELPESDECVSDFQTVGCCVPRVLPILSELLITEDPLRIFFNKHFGHSPKQSFEFDTFVKTLLARVDSKTKVSMNVTQYAVDYSRTFDRTHQLFIVSDKSDEGTSKSPYGTQSRRASKTLPRVSSTAEPSEDVHDVLSKPWEVPFRSVPVIYSYIGEQKPLSDVSCKRRSFRKTPRFANERDGSFIFNMSIADFGTSTEQIPPLVAIENFLKRPVVLDKPTTTPESDENVSTVIAPMLFDDLLIAFQRISTVLGLPMRHLHAFFSSTSTTHKQHKEKKPKKSLVDSVSPHLHEGFDAGTFFQNLRLFIATFSACAQILTEAGISPDEFTEHTIYAKESIRAFYPQIPFDFVTKDGIYSKTFDPHTTFRIPGNFVIDRICEPLLRLVLCLEGDELLESPSFFVVDEHLCNATADVEKAMIKNAELCSAVQKEGAKFERFTDFTENYDIYAMKEMARGTPAVSAGWLVMPALAVAISQLCRLLSVSSSSQSEILGGTMISWNSVLSRIIQRSLFFGIRKLGNLVGTNSEEILSLHTDAVLAVAVIANTPLLMASNNLVANDSSLLACLNGSAAILLGAEQGRPALKQDICLSIHRDEIVKLLQKPSTLERLQQSFNRSRMGIAKQKILALKLFNPSTFSLIQSFTFPTCRMDFAPRVLDAIRQHALSLVSATTLPMMLLSRLPVPKHAAIHAIKSEIVLSRENSKKTFPLADPLNAPLDNFASIVKFTLYSLYNAVFLDISPIIKQQAVSTFVTILAALLNSSRFSFARDRKNVVKKFEDILLQFCVPSTPSPETPDSLKADPHLHAINSLRMFATISSIRTAPSDGALSTPALSMGNIVSSLLGLSKDFEKRSRSEKSEEDKRYFVKLLVATMRCVSAWICRPGFEGQAFLSQNNSLFRLFEKCRRHPSPIVRSRAEDNFTHLVFQCAAPFQPEPQFSDILNPFGETLGEDNDPIDDARPSVSRPLHFSLNQTVIMTIAEPIPFRACGPDSKIRVTLRTLGGRFMAEVSPILPTVSLPCTKILTMASKLAKPEKVSKPVETLRSHSLILKASELPPELPQIDSAFCRLPGDPLLNLLSVHSGEEELFFLDTTSENGHMARMFECIEESCSDSTKDNDLCGIREDAVASSPEKEPHKPEQAVPYDATRMFLLSLGFLGINKIVHESPEEQGLGKDAISEEIRSALQTCIPLRTDDQLDRQLKNLDTLRPHEIHKISVLYVEEDMCGQAEILSNTHGSDNFERFLSGLGFRINVATHGGFVGKLRTTSFPHGTETIYWQTPQHEVLFHVPLLMPTNPEDAQQVHKKKLVGNDFVTIVWNENRQNFHPNTIRSDFNFVTIVCSPLAPAAPVAASIERTDFLVCVRVFVREFGTGFRQMLERATLPLFGPLVNNSIIPFSALPRLVRETAVCANQTIREATIDYKFPYDARKKEIGRIVSQHRFGERPEDLLKFWIENFQAASDESQ